jgi:hypothetical protein
VCFQHNRKNLAGKSLDQEFLDDPQRPVVQLLRWHFRQAVLANMRGAGEPVFENDFPPGSDIVGEILNGQKSAERMPFELLNRLAAQVEVRDVSPTKARKIVCYFSKNSPLNHQHFGVRMFYSRQSITQYITKQEAAG